MIFHGWQFTSNLPLKVTDEAIQKSIKCKKQLASIVSQWAYLLIFNYDCMIKPDLTNPILKEMKVRYISTGKINI